MDQDEEYADTRDELLKKFRESLGLPMSERYFDEDDLIEIFDYAGDLNDDYLRMEALMCGARYFPDSAELLERRGIFYSQYSDDARSSFLNDHQMHGSLILDILGLRSNPPAPENAIEKLDSFLQEYEKLSDEEVIQLVDLASSLNQYQWIKDNLPKLRQKAGYINVLLYETAMVADSYRDCELAASLLEELTEIEPFNSYYWLLLSRQYAELDDGDKALSAIDYSLAIKPDSAQAMLVKARMMYNMDRPAQEVIALLQTATAISPDDTEITRYLASVLNFEGRQDEARDLLEGLLATATPDQEIDIIPDLIFYNPTDIDGLLDRFYRANEENSQLMWASWAQQFSMQGYPELARRVTKCFERNSGCRIPSLFTIEDLFAQQKFEDAICELNDYVKEIGASEADFPTVIAMHVISMVKCGAFVQAYTFCDFFLQNIDISKYKTVANRLEFIGVVNILRDIQNRIANSSHDSYWWEDYDPLQYWSDSNP